MLFIGTSERERDRRRVREGELHGGFGGTQRNLGRRKKRRLKNDEESVAERELSESGHGTVVRGTLRRLRSEAAVWSPADFFKLIPVFWIGGMVGNVIYVIVDCRGPEPDRVRLFLILVSINLES